MSKICRERDIRIEPVRAAQWDGGNIEDIIEALGGGTAEGNGVKLDGTDLSIHGIIVPVGHWVYCSASTGMGILSPEDFNNRFIIDAEEIHGDSEEHSNKDFSITWGRGFHMRLPNGFSISVQFGPATYSDNYNAWLLGGGEDPLAMSRRCGERGANQVECAVINPSGDLIKLPKKFGGDTVTNRSDSQTVLDLIKWASKLKE